MRIRLAIPDRFVNRYTLEGALEAVTRAAEHEIREGIAPDARELIDLGAKWAPEPFTDGEHFDLPSTIARRMVGDCDDWAPALAASLRASGEDPGAVATAYKSGPKTWHCVVRTSDGQILDPSRWAGMRRAGRGVSGAQLAPMACAGDAGIAVVPTLRGGWAARCDLPWPESPGHFASVARSRDPERALARAVVGAAMCADGIGSSAMAQRAEEVAEQIVPLARELAYLGPPSAFRRGRMYREWLPGGAHLMWAPRRVAPLIVRF